MKKLFALLMTLCLLCGCTALADNTLNWEDVEEAVEAAGITGQWYTFDEIAVEIFIPDQLSEQDAPSEDYIGYFASEEGDVVGLAYVNMEGMDLESYASILSEIGATEIELGTLNGMPCLTYEVPANGTINVAFAPQAGYILEAFSGPVTDDNSKTGAAFILASIQPYDDNEEAE